VKSKTRYAKECNDYRYIKWMLEGKQDMQKNVRLTNYKKYVICF